MAYEPRTFQAVTTNTPPTGTDPMVDNTTNGDVQAIKIIDGTAGSTTPLAGQKARAISLSTTLSTEDIAALTPPAAITGYATSAKQDTQITAEQAILAKLLAAPATEAKQDTGNTSLSSIDTKTPALGQALAAASVPIVLTAAQLTTLTPPAAITGYLTESDFDTKTGALTETAPATDTASSGLNGRLQRIAQRLTSLITALGSPFQAGGSIGNTTFASTQSGTWTVQPGNTANSTAWKVDGSAVTQPTSLATLPALVAGTAAIGKLAANSGVDIGDVDVTSISAPTLSTATATIANGASLSGANDLAGAALIRILMPATWTAAVLTFSVSNDNATYYDLYDQFGVEMTGQAAASRAIILSPSDFIGWRYVKIRSGTSASPVNQGGSRDVILATRTVL
jgi:hypothetical protein